MIGPYQVKNYF